MTGSYWHEAAGWADRWVGLPLPRTVEFAVLGGGFAGLATARQLRERHPTATIVVLEAARVGHGASGRNAGFLSPLAAPVWLLGAERAPEQAWGAARLNAEVHALARWIGEVVPAAELRPATLALQAHGRLAEAALHAFARAVAHVGLAHEVRPSRARPGGTVLAMAAYTLQPYALCRGLAAHVAELGVAVRERARVRRVEGLRAGGARVHLEGGAVIEAAKVVACTNAYSGAIDLGERPAALVVHGCLAVTAPGAAAAAVRDGEFTVEVTAAQAYHRLHADRLVLGGLDALRAPGGADAGAVPARTRAHLQALIDARLGPGAPPLAQAWTGRFHATATGLPIIRTAHTNPALVWNVGYGGTGVALALACARLAAGVAADGTFPDADAPRLLALIHATRLRARDAARAIGRIAAAAAMPWRAG